MRELYVPGLEVGSTVRILAGNGEDVNQYVFDVLQAGKTPICDLRQFVFSDGDPVGPVKVRLVGGLENDGPEDETITQMGLRVELKEASFPQPAADRYIKIGGTILVVDIRDGVPPQVKTWHELTPPIEGIALT